MYSFICFGKVLSTFQISSIFGERLDLTALDCVITEHFVHLFQVITGDAVGNDMYGAAGLGHIEAGGFDAGCDIRSNNIKICNAMLLNKSGKCLAGQGVAPTVYRQFAQYPQNSKPAFLHYALVCMPKAHHICSCVRSPYRFLKFNAATKQPNAPFTLQHIRSAFSHKNL